MQMSAFFMKNSKSLPVISPILKKTWVVLGLTLVCACDQSTANQFVARVNKVPISTQLLEDRLSSYEYEQQLNALDKNIEVKEAIVNELIQEELIFQLAQKRGLEVEASEVSNEAIALGIMDLTEEPNTETLLEKRLLEKKLFEAVTQEVPPPSLAEIEKYHQEQKNQFVQRPQVHLLQIIFKQKEELEAALDALSQETSFETLVQKYEQQPMLAMAGDLGFVAKGMLQPEVEKQAFGLRKGQVSKPIETEMGWALLKALDKKEEKIYTLEEVQDKIHQQLWAQNKERHYNQWLKTQLAQANIERNHEIIQQSSP
jgi:parvulin-like peptidyl-prolyl isomerase